ncbi:hypothetical protein AB0910_09910 [Streptomyces sp. NPDC047002]|uniref:hypothetical protein n=1 Tax=Streptomyces sp. NPDC047002 TaxID=3155475 RepID=UPI003455FB34
MNALDPAAEGAGPGAQDPADEHRAGVAAVAGLFRSVLDGLRGLDLGDIPPAAAYRAVEGGDDAAV